MSCVRQHLCKRVRPIQHETSGHYTCKEYGLTDHEEGFRVTNMAIMHTNTLLNGSDIVVSLV